MIRPAFAGWPLRIWCGEGDLNPHEIAPASTSRYLTTFPGVSTFSFFSYLCVVLFRPVSWRLRETVARPLTVSRGSARSVSRTGGFHSSAPRRVRQFPSGPVVGSANCPSNYSPSSTKASWEKIPRRRGLRSDVGVSVASSALRDCGPRGHVVGQGNADARPDDRITAHWFAL